MITFMDSKEKSRELMVEKCLDPQLWHACAGGMVQMPKVNTKVYYFPQGHAEHACGPVNFKTLISPNKVVPPMIPCRVSAVKFMADPETDEVYAKLRLVPLSGAAGNDGATDGENDVGVVGGGINELEAQDKPASFAKTLTQSDANNGGGFSVPRYCAETIFPRLDYTADPPVQNILAKDVHGETWKFRHIYRGTPRRHLLTTGWSTFVNQKKLVAGDSIVFLRAENGDLCVGIRRAKKGLGGGPEGSPVWNPSGGGNCPVPYGGFPGFLKEEDIRLLRNGNGNGLDPSGTRMIGGRGKVRPEAVIEAATLAANMQPFEVVYYPRASTPEFCVRATLVEAALQIRWCSGIRFKMAFETEDSSRISWFMGSITSAQVADPLNWPNSPWRLLQVMWDEPDLLQNVRRVSPWLVELVSNMPALHLSPFSPPRKKLRLPQHPDLIPVYGCLQESTTPAGMQGARHGHCGLSLSELHLSKLQSGLYPAGFPLLDHHASAPMRVQSNLILQKPSASESASCLLSMPTSPHSWKKPDDGKPPQLVLFGQKILTEQQLSLSSSADTLSPVLTGNSSSDGNADKVPNISDEPSSCERLETGHCKVFIESEDVGRTLDLSLLASYDELQKKLADMFGIQKYEMLSRALYRDVTGALKHVGDEPFNDFTRTARRLTILMDSSSDNVGV